MNATHRFQTYEDVLRYQLSGLAETFRTSSGIPGVCIAVATPQGSVQLASGVRSVGSAGSLEPCVHFHIGCVAKLLLSIVVLELAQAGRLSLNAPIGDTLDELSHSIHGRRIALVHLLSHTTGYRSFLLPDRPSHSLTWSGFIEQLCESPRSFPPGVVFSFEHTGAVLAAEIIQRKTGMDLDTRLSELCARLGLSPAVLGWPATAPEQMARHLFDAETRLFRPLGGTEAANQPDTSTDFWRPALSNLSLSIGDIAKIGSALCGMVEGGLEEATISASVRALLQTRVVRIPAFFTAPGFPAELPTGFSLGAAQYDGGWHGISASGAGQCIALRYHPRLQVSIAAGMNTGNLPLLLQLIRGIRLTIAPEGPTELQRCPLTRGIAPDELAGRYSNGNSICDARVDGDRLKCLFTGIRNRPTQIDVMLGGDPPTLASTNPRASITFFRPPVPGASIGLMYGLRAYGRTPQSGV